jgi:DeoR family transcriptional regulator, fructose operon transcriptional repressor
MLKKMSIRHYNGHQGRFPFDDGVEMSQATAERRKLIMSQLLDRKQVTVKELAEEMDVSDATVRRDLKALADEQGLKLIHGGAALPRERDFSFQARLMRAVEEKTIIGSLASKLIREGDHVFLDSGTTCSELVPYVKRMHEITILTNSARLALELTPSGVQLFLIGGEYRPDRMDAIGPMAVSTLNQVRGYTAFIGADGLSKDFGPSASDLASAHLHRQVVANALTTVLLVDHSKFGSASLFQIVEWSQISTVVTDKVPDENWKQFFSDREINLIFPGADGDGKQDSKLTKN